MCKPDHRDLRALAVIFLVAAAMLFPLLMGDRPITGDHAAHYFRAWNLETNLLPRGRLLGWSQMWGMGYPVNYTYPFGGDLLVVALHKLSFGLLTLSQAYALAVFLAWYLIAACNYAFAKPIVGRATALLAALFIVTDPTPHPYGGWSGTIDLRVWPCPLAVAVGLLVLERACRLLERPNWRDSGILGLLTGAALLLHPISVMELGIGIPVLLFSYAICSSGIAWRHVVPKLLTGLLLGAAIGGIFLIPFILTSDYAYQLGAAWGDLYAMTLALLNGTFYHMRILVFISAFALVGTVLLLKSSQPRRFFCGVMLPLLLLCGAPDVGQVILKFLSANLASHVEFPRFGMLAKPFWMLAAAYGIAECYVALRRSFPETDRSTLKARARLAAAVLLTMPFAISTGMFVVKSAHDAWPHLTASSRADKAQLDDIVEWLNEQVKNDPRFYRVAQYLDPDPYHGSLDISTRLHLPLFNVMWTPSILYYSIPRGNSDGIFKLANVRYVMTRDTLSPGQYLLVKTFGNINMYEFKGWVADPIRVEGGEGRVEVQTWENERIDILSHNPGPGTLKLDMTYFPRWQAMLDGKPINIKPETVNDQLILPAVPLHEGHYVFTFEPSAPERLAPLFALAGIIGSFLLIRRRSDAR